jgi:hypothetical protein
MQKMILVFLSATILCACSKSAYSPNTNVPTPDISARADLDTSISQADELVIIGRLKYISDPPGCGIFHYGAIAEYTDLRIIHGPYFRDTIYVVHGCPELDRSEYAEGSGTLSSFQLGDYHILHLTSQNVYDIGTIYAGEEPEQLYEVCKDDPCIVDVFVQRQDGMMYFSSQVDLYSK